MIFRARVSDWYRLTEFTIYRSQTKRYLFAIFIETRALVATSRFRVSTSENRQLFNFWSLRAAVTRARFHRGKQRDSATRPGALVLFALCFSAAFRWYACVVVNFSHVLRHSVCLFVCLARRWSRKRSTRSISWAIRTTTRTVSSSPCWETPARSFSRAQLNSV